MNDQIQKLLHFWKDLSSKITSYAKLSPRSGKAENFSSKWSFQMIGKEILSLVKGW